MYDLGTYIPLDSGPENVPKLFTNAAVAIGPVKCGTMPTKCDS